MADLIAWQNVKMWTATDEWTGPISYALADDDEERALCARKLDEYRQTESIWGAYLGDPADYDEDTDEVCDAGPKVGEIDWTGIDAALESL